jgi:type I restriction enzyme S subunit
MVLSPKRRLMPEVAVTKGWTRVAFGDVVRQVQDRVDPDESGLERFVAGEHMDTGDLRIRRWGTIGNGYLGPAFHMRFKPGHVLYGSRRTYLRKVAVADFEGITANTTFVIESKDPKVLLPGLLPFIMQAESFHEHSKKQSKGSVNPYVNFSDLTWYEFALPPLDEQQRLLSALAATRELEDSASHVLGLTASVRASWLEHEFAMLEKEWPVKMASDLMARITVGIVVRPADLYVPEGKGIPALRSLNVLPDKIVMEELVYISPEGHAEHHKSRLAPGDVVIVRSGRPGDAAVVPADAVELNCIDLIICTVNPALLPHFVCAAVNSRFGRRQFAAGTAGTAQKHFNVGAFKNFRLPLPPLNVQSEFVARLQDFTRIMARAEGRLDEVRRLQTSLMKRIFET